MAGDMLEKRKKTYIRVETCVRVWLLVFLLAWAFSVTFAPLAIVF